VPPTNKIKYRLSADNRLIRDQAISINFQLENTSNEDIWVLTWYIPLDGLTENRKPKQINGVMLDFVSKHEYKRMEFVTPAFNNCTMSEEQNVREASGVAENISTAAALALHYRQNKSQYDRYVEWFGNFDDTLYNTVTSNLENISTAIRIETIVLTATDLTVNLVIMHMCTLLSHMKFSLVIFGRQH
jgi:hypothetical protein